MSHPNFAQSISSPIQSLYSYSPAPPAQFNSDSTQANVNGKIGHRNNYLSLGNGKAFKEQVGSGNDEKNLIDFSSGNEGENDNEEDKFVNPKALKHLSAPVRLHHHHHHHENRSDEEESEEERIVRDGISKLGLSVGVGMGMYTDYENEADDEDGGEESEGEGSGKYATINAKKGGMVSNGAVQGGVVGAEGGFTSLAEILTMKDNGALDPQSPAFIMGNSVQQIQQSYEAGEDQSVQYHQQQQQQQQIYQQVPITQRPPSPSSVAVGIASEWKFNPAGGLNHFISNWVPNNNGSVKGYRRSESPGETSGGDGEDEKVVYRRNESKDEFSIGSNNSIGSYQHHSPISHHSDSDLSRSNSGSKFSIGGMSTSSRYGSTSASSTPGLFSGSEGKSPLMTDIGNGVASGLISPPKAASPALELERAREELKGRLSPVGGGNGFNVNSLPFIPRGSGQVSQQQVKPTSRSNSLSNGAGSPLRNGETFGREQDQHIQHIQQQIVMGGNGFVPASGFGFPHPHIAGSFGVGGALGFNTGIPPQPNFPSNGFNNPFPPRSSSLSSTTGPILPSAPVNRPSLPHSRTSENQQSTNQQNMNMDQMAAYKVAELTGRRPGSRAGNPAMDSLPNINAALAQLTGSGNGRESQLPQQQFVNALNEFANSGMIPPQMIPSLIRAGPKTQQFNTASFGPPPMTSPYSKEEIQAQLGTSQTQQSPQQQLSRTMPAVPLHMRQFSQPPIPPVSPAFSTTSTVMPNSATPVQHTYTSLSRGQLSPEEIESIVRDPAFADLIRNFANDKWNGSGSASGSTSPGSNAASSGANQSQQSQSQSQGQQGGKEGLLPGPSGNNRKAGLFKTELCRSWEEKGSCRYGSKCQFAHGKDELKVVTRHPKYKTEVCRTFWLHGSCPYGKRCCFIHTTVPGGGSGAPPDPSHLPPGAITEVTAATIPKKFEEPTSRLHQRMSSQSSSTRSSFGPSLSSYLGPAISSSESSGSSSPVNEPHLSLDSPSAFSEPGLNTFPSNGRVSLDNSDIPSYLSNSHSSRSSLPATPSSTSLVHKHSLSYPTGHEDDLFGTSPSKAIEFPKSSPALSWSGPNNNSSSFLPLSQSFDGGKGYWGESLLSGGRRSLASPTGFASDPECW